MDEGLTWQKAKAKTQAMELEIAHLIPEDKVIQIDQKRKGILFGCSGPNEFYWDGATTITLKKGVEPEPLVKSIEEHFRDSRFDIKVRPDIEGVYEVRLESRVTAESYAISELESDSIRIWSGSDCFTVPEDMYTGGKF